MRVISPARAPGVGDTTLMPQPVVGDRFELLRLAGTGGMGSVYEAPALAHRPLRDAEIAEPAWHAAVLERVPENARALRLAAALAPTPSGPAE